MINFIKNFFSKQKIQTFNIEYYLNDPTTPNLKSTTPLPKEDPKFTINYWNKINAPVNDVQKQAAQTYVYVCKSLETANKYLGSPIKWKTNRMTVLPRAGVDFNAYYDRESLRFFYNKNPQTNKVVYMCDSFDIVSHEVGHAVLDFIREDFWNIQSLEIFAFHEAFADIFSIITLMQENILIEYILNESKNDLFKDNCINKLGEEVGSAIYLTNKNKSYSDCMRKVNIDLKYEKPEMLPLHADNPSLSKEPHNFSRILTSSWYECFVVLYRYFLDKPSSPFESFVMARDIMAKSVFDSIRVTSNSSGFFINFVKNLINSIQEEQIRILLRNVFIKRKLVSNLMIKRENKKINETKKLSFIDLVKFTSSKSKLSSFYLPNEFLQMNFILPGSATSECGEHALKALRYLYVSEEIDLHNKKDKLFYKDNNNDLLRFKICGCQKKSIVLE